MIVTLIMELDIKTLSIVSGGLAWLISLMMWFIHIRSRNIKGPIEWGIGHLLNGIGIFLFASAQYISPFFSLLVSNFLIISGDCFF